MSNKLFIICPFSCLEHKLKQRYGSNAFFVTCPAAIIPYNDVLFIEVLKEAIIQHNIQSVYFVNDSASGIINAVLMNKTLFGLDAEKCLNSIYQKAYSIRFKGRSIPYQQFRLAELNVQYQKDEFLLNGIFTDVIIDNKINVKTLVISNTMQVIKESRIASSVKVAYEL